MSLALDEAAWTSRWRTRAVGDKALLCLGLLAAALLLPWPGAALAGLAAVGCALGWARVPLRLMTRALAAPLVFVLVGAVSIALSVGAVVPDAVWSWGPFSTAPGALVRAGTTSVRALAGCACLVLLAATTPMADLLAAARRARVPGPCIEIASLMYRLVFVLLASARTIREAQAGRLGYAGLSASYRSTAALVAGVLVRSWAQARRLEDGLAGRGYESEMPTLAPRRHHSTSFCAAAAVLVLVVVALGVLA